MLRWLWLPRVRTAHLNFGSLSGSDPRAFVSKIFALLTAPEAMAPEACVQAAFCIV